MRQPKQDLTELIFAATDNLMAKQGFHSLSMHKIAKDAGISVGTIYLYFKNKDELIKRFAYRTIDKFLEAIAQNYDENASYFEQYRQMWWNIWHFLQENPTILSNLSQYQYLPSFSEACQNASDKGIWEVFCKKAQLAGELPDLPSKLLFLLGLESAMNMALDVKFFNFSVSEEILNAVIERSWRAIRK
ncbi:TetR/AcrR family transcriptional regulator [Rodentibacter caecimuris]|uniref:TetR family transcriptional regulator n=1 Tax=Rodentibacter caecimuris TaxID=1796644 RepID=A0ABX3KYR9_9PAST|nr:TetR family transcriptional regulator [Rodentibacter heylii]